MGNLYAQLVILSIRAFKAIPEPLQPYAVYAGYNWYVQLSGRRTIAEGFDCITDLVRNGTAEYVYISPFENSLIGMNQAQLFRSMLKRLPAGWDGGGYGAAVLDEYRNALLYCKCPAKQVKPTPKRTIQPMEVSGWRIFITGMEAGNFIAAFLQHGGKRKVYPEARPMDPELLQWLCNTCGKHIEAPADLEQITELKAEDFSSGAPVFPDWLCPVYGDWRVIGSLPRLEKLEFPHVCIDNFSFLLRCRRLKYLDLSKTNFYEGPYLERLENLNILILPPAEVTDFLFLKTCKHISFLDVSKTNFVDCSLLLELPELETMYLPPKHKLLRFDTIETIAASIFTDEPKNEDERDTAPALYCSNEKLPLGENGFYAQALVMDGKVYREKQISKELVQSIAHRIRSAEIKHLTISSDADMESILFTADIKEGWAALALQDFTHDVYYVPDNPKCHSLTKPAPPRIGGQSPVTQSEALDDLQTAADCVRHFIQFGKLYPEIRWITIN